MSKKVMLIAGEVSGDMRAAEVVRALRRQHPEVQFFGIGGSELRAAGMEIIHDAREMAVLGITEVLKRLGFFKQVFYQMLDLAAARKPDAVILVDYPGFNLRLAKKIHKMGIKVIYYICPQVWAWHRSRIQQMARVVDRLIVIFPFEPDVFKGTGLPTDFVGHPLVDETAKSLKEPLMELPWKGPNRVAILPGSREQEIERILPLMAAAAAQLEKQMPDISLIVAAPSEEIAACVRSTLNSVKRKPTQCEVVPGATRQVLRQARAAMVASGTATLETALMGCPMIVVYKTSLLTYLTGRMLIRVPHLGMVNIVAGESLCPEFLQNDAQPDAMAAGLEPLIRDTPQRAHMAAGLERVRRSLGEGGAAQRAADIIMSELK